MGRTFLDLPPELQSAAVAWVLYPHHIASICLVSRQLFDISTPFLYHTMYLNVDRWKKGHLESFLTPGHKGHEYVRTLDVDSDELNTEPDARKLAKDILQVLPRHCLTSFRCPLETGIDNDLMILLSSTQKNLSFLSLGPLMQNAVNVPTCLRPWPARLKTVVIPWKINIDTDLSFYRELIERSANLLQALTVRSETLVNSLELADPKQTFKRFADEDFHVRELFAQILIHERQPAIEIGDLNLQNQELARIKSTWIRAIDFTKLRTLQLWNCTCADNLLVELMEINRTTPLQLNGLVLSFEEPEQAPLRGLEFIRSLSGLRYINLCYCPKNGPEETPSITGGLIEYALLHGETIKDLYFGLGANHMRQQKHYVPDKSELRRLSRKCTKIRQLAIAMPWLHVDDVFTGLWEQTEFGQCLERIAAFPKLKVFRILTWPVIGDAEYLGLSRFLPKRAHRRKIYLKYLDIIATCIARRVCHVRRELQRQTPETEYQGLSVLIFGSAEELDMVTRPDGTQDCLQTGPISYKIRRKETEFGAILKAKRIDSQLMESEEPIAYVVDEDTDQGLSLEAYSWGSCNPSWL